MERFTITAQDTVPNEIREAAIAVLASHSAKSGGIAGEDKPFSILAHAEERVVGGLIGKVFWNWLYADIVWVDEDCRGQGVGTELMKCAEERAVDMKLTGIYLWTETWQAPAFYRKLGYTQYVEFRDFPPGHSRLGFRKYLRTET
jgi:GNAT superfamily N-acetyltransferase